MLKEHMRVHDNIREYLCAECGKGMRMWGRAGTELGGCRGWGGGAWGEAGGPGAVRRGKVTYGSAGPDGHGLSPVIAAGTSDLGSPDLTHLCHRETGCEDSVSMRG